jgi:hypothetical protein
MRFLLLIFSVFLALLLVEGLTRCHHYLRYGIKNPIFSHTVFYDGFMLKSMQRDGVKIYPHPQPRQAKKVLVLSGGSVAWGFRAKKSARVGLLLQKKLGVPVLDLSFPGKDLKSEIKTLLNLKPKNIREIVFLSGFNDIFQIGLVEKMQKQKLSYITQAPFLNHSLFFHKVFERVVLYFLRTNYNSRMESSEIQAEMQGLYKQFPNQRISFFFQPMLSSNKVFGGRETEIFSFYRPRYNQGLKQKQVLVRQLKSLAWLNYIDLQKSFDGIKEEVFLDICHLNAKGAAILGELMGDELLRAQKEVSR